MAAANDFDVHSDLVESESASVLIVDDRPTSRALLKAVLEQQNYAITEAAGGNEAVALIAGRTFDLVVLDIVMPDLNGMDVLKKIRAQYAETELPVIMVTVKHDIEDVVQALELGANDYVTKPIDYAILIARIRTQLSRKRAVSALQDARVGLERRIAERTAELVHANEALESEIAERHQAEQALRASEARFRTFYDFTPSMFLTISLDGVIESVNSFGATQLGYTVDELVGLSAAGIHEDDKQFQEYFNSCVDAPDEVHRWELGVIKKNGSLMWVRESGRVVDALDRHAHVLVACEDMTEARRLSEELTYQATHDTLTGLLNRGEF
ncbi:MAG: response regulator, partial [Gammaproteobacteria bacterium]|nr:response regulator [Gammaproteobacteria bacterium]